MGMKNAGRHNIYKYWAGIYFNADEDLVMVSAEGCIYIIDIVLSEIKDRTMLHEFQDGDRDKISDKIPHLIVDSRFD